MPRNGKDENTDVRLFGYAAAHDSIQSQHVDRDHLVAFLLNGTPFESDEYAHLLRCSECTVAMFRAATEELDRQESRLQR